MIIKTISQLNGTLTVFYFTTYCICIVIETMKMTMMMKNTITLIQWILYASRADIT